MGAGTLVGGGGRAGKIGEPGSSGEHIPETAATEGSPAGCEAGRWAQVIPSLVFHHIHCAFRRLLRSARPAVLWVSLVRVPLRRWVGSPHRSWRVALRPHRLLWIRWVRSRRTGPWIRWRVPLVHQGPAEYTSSARLKVSFSRGPLSLPLLVQCPQLPEISRPPQGSAQISLPPTGLFRSLDTVLNSEDSFSPATPFLNTPGPCSHPRGSRALSRPQQARLRARSGSPAAP